ncbi:hypothetical protein B0G80_3669 [Paraburkholderia sp. BL6669N2]|nr:hypothetical protein B0G80_3669 [Paraburkholderia sp. BL6669N2]
MNAYNVRPTALLARTVEEAADDLEFQRELHANELEVLTKRVQARADSSSPYLAALRRRSATLVRALQALG